MYVNVNELSKLSMHWKLVSFSACVGNDARAIEMMRAIEMTHTIETDEDCKVYHHHSLVITR